MKEEWKDIIGFDGYQISDNGRVRSPRQILKQQVNHKGYCVVRLSRGRNYKRSFYVHRLVAEYFIENPNGYPQINHIDKDKSNNAKSNLEWCDNLYNQKHSWENGRRFVRNGCDKKVAVYKNDECIGVYESITKSLTDLNIPLSNKGNVTYVLQGKRKKMQRVCLEICLTQRISLASRKNGIL